MRCGDGGDDGGVGRRWLWLWQMLGRWKPVDEGRSLLTHYDGLDFGLSRAGKLIIKAILDSYIKKRAF